MKARRKVVQVVDKKAIARRAFRDAWLQYVTCTNPLRRMDLQRAMDAVQPDCVDTSRPAEEWDEFAVTVPCYLKYWGEVSKIVKRGLEERERQKRESSNK